METMHLDTAKISFLGVQNFWGMTAVPMGNSTPMVKQNVAQYPPHHVTYAPPKFEVATLTRAAVDGTPSQIPAFFYLRYTLMPMSHKMLASTLYTMSPRHL